jgi:RimJ/RimL family protein N-acetyltransferase
MELAGARSVVRTWRRSDAASLVRHANNVNIAKHLRDRFPHPYTERDARTFLRMVGLADDRAINLAIDVDGTAVGAIGLTRGSDVERFSAEIGYWLAEPYWGRGIATEALILVTAEAFARLNILRLFALPFADNLASARVLEKAGYVREGRLQSSAVKYGEPRDQLLFARVNGNWRAPQA